MTLLMLSVEWTATAMGRRMTPVSSPCSPVHALTHSAHALISNRESKRQTDIPVIDNSFKPCSPDF